MHHDQFVVRYSLSNPNLLYFGNTENTLNGLNYYPNNDSSQTIVTNASYANYEKSLTGNNKFYNNYFKKEAAQQMRNKIGENDYFEYLSETFILNYS